MAEKIVSNYEFSFILKKENKEYDLGLCDSITDAWTNTNTDVNRYSYKGLTSHIATASDFQVTCTGVNDLNNPTYKLFKDLYGGDLLNLQGFILTMTFPLADDEILPKIITVPAALSFSAGFTAASNDLSRFSVVISANGAMKITNSVTKDQVQLNTKLTQTDLSTEVVPVALSTDKPVAGQIVNSVIALNPDLTINDFNIDQDSVEVTKEAMEKDDPNNSTGEYVNGEYKAIATGVAKYYGDVSITGKFGRLNP